MKPKQSKVVIITGASAGVGRATEVNAAAGQGDESARRPDVSMRFAQPAATSS